MSFRLGIIFILSFFLLLTLPSLFAQKVNGKGGDTHAADSAKDARKAALDSIKQAHAYTLDSTKDARKKALDSVRAAQKEKVSGNGGSYSSDSAKDARKEALDSVKEARTHILDSTKEARKRTLDSVKAVRKIYADSVGALHKYRDSKHYKDSVIHARTLKTDAIKKQRKDNLDVLKAARKKTTDSTIAARKLVIDKMKAIQKHRSDSLAVIKKYKSSKRYTDSVTLIRHDRLDSLRDARKEFNDSMFAVRKKQRDLEKAIRKHSMDSTAAIRTKYTDSVKAVRKKRADELAKQKAEREKLAKSRENLQQKKLQLAIDLKIKSKHEKWSNQQMLKKKWRPVRRAIQNTFTRYNYFYNSDKKMDEALLNMQRTRRENYDTLIGLYSFDPNRDSSLLSADMDSIIHKASVGIQIHDPRTKWGDDLYLLLGEANYYKGRYKTAGTAFRYIISMDEEKKKKLAQKNGTSSKTKGEQPSIVEDNKKTMLDFLKHRTVHNEAILWLARTFTESHNIENASSVLSLLDADPKLPESLKGRIAMEKAFVALNEANYKEAATQLDIAAKDDNLTNVQRQRAAYLNGQLQQRDGNYTGAVASFKQVLDMNPKIELDFYARKYMAYNTMYAGGDVDGMISSLKKVLNDGKYVPYYDQVYYILGQLAAAGHNIEDAIAYLNKSIKTPKSTKKQKAISFATLGNVLYTSNRYVEAKRAYDSAALLAANAPGDTLMITAIRRSRVLGQITGPMAIIHAEDSLLELASLGDKDQRAAIRKYLRMLQQQKDDSAYKAENGGVLAAAAQQGEGTDVASWYFANPALMQQGNSEFKRKWGGRTLTDNWARASGISLTAGVNAAAAADSTAAANNGKFDENGLPTIESLLAEIPNSEDAKAKAWAKEQRAYIDLAKAYVKELEDYPQALKTLDTLDSRFPDHKFKPDALYLRYLVALRQGRLDDAQAYSAQLLKQYPESPLAVLMRPAQDTASVAATAAANAGMANFYDETYSLLIQHQYEDVLTRTRTAIKQYKDSTYSNRFRIMQAIAMAGQGQYRQADTLLAEYLHAHPSDSLRDWAESVVKYISKNAKDSEPEAVVNSQEHYRQWPYYDYTHKYSMAEDGSIQDGSHGDTVYSSANPYHKPVANPVGTPLPGNLPGLISFTYTPQAQHYVVVKFPEIDLRATALRNAIIDTIAAKFADTTMTVHIDILSTEQSTMAVKAFPNAAAAATYMQEILNGDLLDKYKPGEVSLFIISADNYKILLRDRSIDPYLFFYSQNYTDR